MKTPQRELYVALIVSVRGGNNGYANFTADSVWATMEEAQEQCRQMAKLPEVQALINEAEAAGEQILFNVQPVYNGAA